MNGIEIVNVNMEIVVVVNDVQVVDILMHVESKIVNQMIKERVTFNKHHY